MLSSSGSVSHLTNRWLPVLHVIHVTLPGCLCRLACVWAVGMVLRMKFYFVWTLADANFTLAGFGFNGWEDKPRRKARWDRHTNGWPLQIEFAGSTAELMRVWNARTGTFLRRCAASIAVDAKTLDCFPGHSSHMKWLQPLCNAC
jgi:hypothetical protein